MILFFPSYQQVEMENSRYQKALAETTQMYEGKIAQLSKQFAEEHSRSIDAEEQLNSVKKLLNEQQSLVKVNFPLSYSQANSYALISCLHLYAKIIENSLPSGLQLIDNTMQELFFLFRPFC